MWQIGDVVIVDGNHGLVATLIFFTALALVVCSMRMFTRAFLVRSMGYDDLFLVVGFLFSLGFTVASMYQIKYGLGDRVDPDRIISFLKSLYFSIVTYSASNLAIKFSLLFMYWRLFPIPVARRILFWISIYLTSFAVITMFMVVFTCVPVAKYWDDSISGGCVNRSHLHYSIAAVNIINDWIFFWFPLPLLKSLQIQRAQKVVLVGIFACGLFACVVPIIRYKWLVDNLSGPIDQQPISGVGIDVWSSLELNVAIICASVPSLKALFKKQFGTKPASYDFSTGARTDKIRVQETIQIQTFTTRETVAAGRGASDDSDVDLILQGSTRTECYYKAGDAESARGGRRV